MSNTVTLQINEKEVTADKEMTVLEAAKRIGIEIPTLCYHEDLEPFGVCRFCSVEIEKKGRTNVVAACCYPVEEGLKVRTVSPKLSKMRKTIIELAAASSGEDVSGRMRALASEYDADLSRFRKKVQSKETKCILCGLCVRRCTEANWDGAIGFIGRGIRRDIVIFPEKARLCSICNYCRNVCPTGRISSSYGADPPFPELRDVLAGRK
jgi:NADH dehydrogenase/NADH:ubiquinone oxidoreductase subunit G